MSLLSKFFHRKYMIKTLTERMNQTEKDQQETKPTHSRLSAINETYESAANGFFASSGEIVNK